MMELTLARPRTVTVFAPDRPEIPASRVRFGHYVRFNWKLFGVQLYLTSCSTGAGLILGRYCRTWAFSR